MSSKNGKTYKLRDGCPTCGRIPNVRFAEREVLRAHKDRQAARLQNHQCTKCGTVYWIRARDVAGATLDKRKKSSQRAS